jgi:serine/alanine adding enzyme
MMNETLVVRVLRGAALKERLQELEAYALRRPRVALSYHPDWLYVLRDGLGHVPMAIEATRGEATVGILPLAFVRSTLFGRYLAALPYLNMGGVQADDAETSQALVNAAVQLADTLKVKHLELRHEAPVEHPKFNGAMTSKVHMRLALPSFTGQLWDSLTPKVRNQVRKGEKQNLVMVWGGLELLPELYEVFARNMRDLGTPVYSPKLFEAMLRYFPKQVEIGVVRLPSGEAIAAGVLCHGKGVTEIPSASSLREHNATCANMFMYWNMLQRAIERGSEIFDFGRSTMDGNTFKFKKQWGAEPFPATWQFYSRKGSMKDVRPDNPKYARFIQMWQKLPVGVTKVIGPRIVRGIP